LTSGGRDAETTGAPPLILDDTIRKDADDG
jgi:hypothetical protein